MSDALRMEFPPEPSQTSAVALCIPEGYWYLASPYSHWPAGHEDAFQTAANVAGKLLALGVFSFSPIAHTHPIYKYTPQVQKLKHADWMRFDKPFVDAAFGTVVACMDGWETSQGVQMEIEWTRKAGKPLYLLDIDYYTIRSLD